MTNCLWNDNEDKHRCHLANWESVCMCRKYGGVGIPNLRDLNIFLLASWLKRDQANDGQLWKQVIDDKYDTDRPNIFYCNMTGSSRFLRGDVGSPGNQDGI